MSEGHARNAPRENHMTEYDPITDPVFAVVEAARSALVGLCCAVTAYDGPSDLERAEFEASRSAR
jgi:hypothetical protein